MGVLMSNLSAQETTCLAESKFSETQCVENPGSAKCVEISVVPDPSGKNFIYEWDLGDGTLLRGESIEHCYEQKDAYEVRLHLIDPVSGLIIRDELSKIIDIEDQNPPKIVVADEVIQNTPINIAYKLDGQDFDSMEVYWAFGDGNYSCQPQPMHTYSESGQVELRMLIIGVRSGEETVLCASKTVTIKEFTFDGNTLNDVFEQKEQTLEDRGRFLNDEAHYIIYEKENPKMYQLFLIKDDQYNVLIETEKDYEMYAWKGNLFTPIQSISTKGMTMEESHVKLKSSIDQLFSKEPLHLDGFRFELDVSDPPVKNLDAIAETMKTYAHVNIAIGVYTHTGGRLDKNIILSKQRGQQVKDDLTERGVAEDRLEVVTAKEEHSLLNTCYGVIHCDLEDETLNRKTEFKVIGVLNSTF